MTGQRSFVVGKILDERSGGELELGVSANVLVIDMMGRCMMILGQAEGLVLHPFEKTIPVS